MPFKVYINQTPVIQIFKRLDLVSFIIVIL